VLSGDSKEDGAEKDTPPPTMPERGIDIESGVRRLLWSSTSAALRAARGRGENPFCRVEFVRVTLSLVTVSAFKDFVRTATLSRFFIAFFFSEAVALEESGDMLPM